MNISRCYHTDCNVDTCFAECNNLYPFICYLTYLHKKLIKYDDIFTDNQHQKAYLLRQDFQKKYLDLITTFENDFDKIATENTD